jgi:hypothetical protein
MRQAVAMRRRVTYILAGLLALTAVVAFAAPRPERKDDPTPRTVGATASGTPEAGTVAGTLPRDKVVRARVGDMVELTVTSTDPDSASVEEFGLTDGTSPGAPARFSFLADRAGRFEVRLLLTNERVGAVVVKE